MKIHVGVRAAAALATRRRGPSKLATVANSDAGPAPDAAASRAPAVPADAEAAPVLNRTARRRALRASRRAVGECIECGAPAGGRARCTACTARVAARAARRRSLAAFGEAMLRGLAAGDAGAFEAAALEARRRGLLPGEEAGGSGPTRAVGGP